MDDYIIFEEKERAALLELIREYLGCIADVPMRAVDCDQELEESLREKLAEAADYKGREATRQHRS
jgi:hypothetical protein